MIDDDASDLAGLFGGSSEGGGGRRLERGDGRPLEPFEWWEIFTGRSLFGLVIDGPAGSVSNYAVDLRVTGRQAGDEGAKAHLYRDGRHVAASDLPAVFPVEGGVIEVAMSAFGLKRMHYVAAVGLERTLAPHPRSAVALRSRLEDEHPALSRRIATASLVVLLVGVGVNAPQLMETISHLAPFAERFGTFTSPIRLPLWLNIALGAGAVLASIERGLRFRYHWLLDGLGT